MASSEKTLIHFAQNYIAGNKPLYVAMFSTRIKWLLY